MKRVILWQLPIVDVFALRRILRYYRSVGVIVPEKHARMGLLERWAGYLPAGFLVGMLFGFTGALLLVLAVFSTVGPLELLLMVRGVAPWRFFKRRGIRTVSKIFLLEGYNAVGYCLLGAWISTFF